MCGCDDGGTQYTVFGFPGSLEMLYPFSESVLVDTDSLETLLLFFVSLSMYHYRREFVCSCEDKPHGFRYLERF